MGVHPEDMLLTLSAHATSKIASSSDLERIMTLGFRGEALASISSVSELTLTSAQAHYPHAWRVKAQGRDILPIVQPAAHPVGTSVHVQKLFYNTPARRKFLRSARTEWQYTEEVIQRVLLSRFDVDFSITHNDKKIARYPIAEKKSRIAKVLSPAFIEVAHPIDACTTHLHLTGFVAPSDFTRSSYDWQYFYINGRMVKDKLIQHAMRQAFGERLYPGRYAAYVLYLTLDPAHIDVNVHPTKHEVRFHNTRLVHDFIVKTIQDALQSPMMETVKTPRYTQPLVQAEKLSRTSGEFLTCLNNQLLISKTAKGLGIIDIHAYYAYQAHHVLSQSPIARQPLLTAQSFSVSAKQGSWLLHHQDHIHNIGFTVDQFGDKTWILREIPAVLSRADTHQLWATLLTTTPNDWIALLSCVAIPQEGIVLSSVEREQMLDSIDTFPESARCPHGLKVWQCWSLDEMRR
jgi:DNA mismatch repair protein MutL